MKQRKPGKTIAVSFGSWGGIYAKSSTAGLRLCLGWVAIDMLYAELDTTFHHLLGDIKIAEESAAAHRYHLVVVRNLLDDGQILRAWEYAKNALK